MDKNHFKKIFLPCVALAGALALTGCTDNDYDFDQVDMTVGIGGDGLSLPVNSTDTIKLDDVLELDGSDCVKVKADGDYVFEQVGDDVAPVHPMIDKIVVSGTSTEGEITLRAVAGAAGYVVTAEGNAQSFTYSGDRPEEVKSLDYVGVDGRLKFTVTFPAALKNAVPTVDKMEVRLPSYMHIGTVEAQAAHTVAGSTITFTNVPTNRSLEVNVPLERLDFGVEDAYGKVELDGWKVRMTGNVHVAVSATVGNGSVAGVDGSRIRSSMNMGNVTIESAYGLFEPEITLNNLGTVDITGVPDFLKGDNVDIDLYNPQILLNVSNDMDIQGYIDGTIEAVKDGNGKSIKVNRIPVNPSGVTKVCICRRGEVVDRSLYDEVIPVENLSTIINPIPDQVKFTAVAYADASKEGYFEFGKQYNVKPDYRVEAPITFDENASIEYTDTLDGWNDDINDFELSDGAYINMTTTIENRIPAYLDLKVEAIDVDGNVMGDDEISVKVSNTVLAAAGAEESSKTPLSVDIRQNGKGAFKRLDGLVFHIVARSYEEGQKTMTGQTLNAYKHFLIADDINVKLVGKVIGDFN